MVEVGGTSRRAIVITNSNYKLSSSSAHADVTFPPFEQGLFGPHYDGRRIGGALECRGFGVSTHTDLDSHGISSALSKFLTGDPCNENHEIVLLYYAGHGVRSGSGASKVPHAVGVDGEAVDLQASFVEPLDAAYQRAGISIIVIMDACLHEQGGCDALEALADEMSTKLKMAHPPHHIRSRSRESLDLVTQGSNLKVFAHSNFRGGRAPQHRPPSGAVTSSILRSMEQDDSDVVAMLQLAAKDLLTNSKSTARLHSSGYTTSEPCWKLLWSIEPESGRSCSLSATPSLDVFSESTQQADGNSTLADLASITSYQCPTVSQSTGLPEIIEGCKNETACKALMLHTINRMLDCQTCFAVESIGLLILQRSSTEHAARFQGENSVVQLAFCSSTGKEYALKIYACLDSYAAEKAFYQHVLPILSAHGPSPGDVQFPHGYAFVDSVQAEGSAGSGLPTPPYAVLERADSMAAAHRDHHSLDRLTAFNVIKAVADRLSSLHEAGLVHGSLHCSDVVWLRRTQAWTVIDFSSATTCGHSCSLSGSLGSAPPEVVQMVEKGQVVVATGGLDSWALGVLALRLLSEEQMVDDVLTRHTDVRYRDWETKTYTTKAERAAGLPSCGLGSMPAVLAGLLHPDAEKRTTCRDVIEFFDSITQPQLQPAPPHPPSGPPSVHRRYALVIGNSAYACDNFEPLQCPMHDAYRMQQELHVRGFHVALGLDLNQVGMRKALDKFVGDFRQLLRVGTAQSGHGGQGKASPAPYAVGIDGGLVNLQRHFIRAADSASTGGRNAIVVLADACLTEMKATADTTSAPEQACADDKWPLLCPEGKTQMRGLEGAHSLAEHGCVTNSFISPGNCKQLPSWQPPKPHAMVLPCRSLLQPESSTLSSEDKNCHSSCANRVNPGPQKASSTYARALDGCSQWHSPAHLEDYPLLVAESHHDNCGLRGSLGNLVIGAHATQPGTAAVQPDRMLYGLWTSCLLEALMIEDRWGADIMNVLARAGMLMKSRPGTQIPRPPYYLFTPGELHTISLARPMCSSTDSQATSDTSSLQDYMPQPAANLAAGAYRPAV